MEGEEKVKSLMHYCFNWGDEGCHPDVSKHKYPKKLKEGEEIPVWPVGEELEKLDGICKECEYRFFEIETNECPVCGNTALLSQPEPPKIWPPTSFKLQGWSEQFIYKCEKCGSYLYSFREL